MKALNKISGIITLIEILALCAAFSAGNAHEATTVTICAISGFTMAVFAPLFVWSYREKQYSQQIHYK